MKEFRKAVDNAEAQKEHDLCVGLGCIKRLLALLYKIYLQELMSFVRDFASIFLVSIINFPTPNHPPNSCAGLFHTPTSLLGVNYLSSLTK